MNASLNFVTLLCFLALSGVASAQAITNAPDSISLERPLIAIWEDVPGFKPIFDAPFLRIAIWNDGNVLFATNPTMWSHGLRHGKISPDRVARLKAAISDSGVFDLKITGIYPVDSARDCIMVDLGTKQQLLSCDESGLRHVTEPQNQGLKTSWKALNQLALDARPDKFETVDYRFIKAPRSWFLRKDKSN